MSDGMKQDWLDDELRRSLQSEGPAAPAFDQVFAAAEAEVSRQRHRRRTGAGIAALAAAVVVGVVLRPATPTDEFLIQESLLSGTHLVSWKITLLALSAAGVARDSAQGQAITSTAITVETSLSGAKYQQ